MEGSENLDGEGREACGADAAPLELATDWPRLTAREYRAESVVTELSGETGVLLEKIGSDTGVTELVVVLTVWAVVLHRHTARTELPVFLDVESFVAEEAPAAGRGLLPVSLRPHASASFAEELVRVRETVSAAVRALRDGGAPGRSEHVGAVVGVTSRAGVERAADVTLTLERSARGAALALTYNASLFTRSTADWLLGHCRRLLSGAVADPDLSTGELRIQDEPRAESTWDLPVPPGFVAPEPAGPEETVVDRWRQQAAAHGARRAVVGASASLTYEELDRVTDAAARLLGRYGGAGKRIGLLCGHDLGSVVAPLAVLKTGAAYVPLDPRQSDSRLTRLVADADVSAVLCDAELADRAAVLARGRRVVKLEPGGTGAGGTLLELGTDAFSEPDPEALAYLLYTSGSTGRPKAVMQRQHNVLAHALAYASRVRLGPDDRVPLLARYTFDAAVMDLFGALLSGATLHVLDPMLPSAEFRDRLAAAGTTVLHCTPTLFRHLLGDLPEPAERHDALRTVRVVVLGGEEATQRDLHGFRAAFPASASLVNGLGPTECTLVLQHLATRADLGRAVLPVGLPVDGIRVRLIGEDGRPTEVFGELEVVSDRVAFGYWGQSDLTVGAFGTAGDGTRSYRTGDLARRRADGSLVFEGRKDRQVKIRGYRIEPGEIEVVLRGHPTVAEAVLTVDTRQSAPRLVGYVTPATAFPPDTHELMDFLARTLPDYAVPWRIVALDTIPVGPTGKVDRARLPLPDETVDEQGDAPGTPLERAVADIWCRILGISSASLHGNFMSSGGDSIRLLEMLTEVKEELGAEVPLTDFLASPTVATLATLIEREKTC